MYDPARGVQAHFDGGHAVILPEEDLAVVGARRDFLQALEKLPRPGAQLVGNLAMACGDDDAHMLNLPPR